MREYMKMVEEERVDEIEIVDDFDGSAFEMARVLDRWSVIGHKYPTIADIGGYDLRFFQYGNTDTYYLFEKGSEPDTGCVGRIVMLNNRVASEIGNAVMVSHVVIAPAVRRKGLALKVYEYILNDTRIISDTAQTKGAMSLWRELASKHVVRPLIYDENYDYIIGDPITDTLNIYNRKHDLLIVSKK